MVNGKTGLGAGSRGGGGSPQEEHRMTCPVTCIILVARAGGISLLDGKQFRKFFSMKLVSDEEDFK